MVFIVHMYSCLLPCLPPKLLFHKAFKLSRPQVDRVDRVDVTNFLYLYIILYSSLTPVPKRSATQMQTHIANLHTILEHSDRARISHFNFTHA